LTLVDRDLGRTNLNFKRHDASSYARRVYRNIFLGKRVVGTLLSVNVGHYYCTRASMN